MALSLWILSAGFCFFLGAAGVHIFSILCKPNFTDDSAPKQDPSAGVIYSFTAGMSPLKKESAYLHYPTYIAGIFYHSGTFLSFLLVLLHLTLAGLPGFIIFGSSGLLGIAVLSGAGILMKRILLPKMRSISDPDDYFSNIIVTVFQMLSLLALWQPPVLPYLFGLTGLLLFAIPVSKLRHAMYFFFARIYLGLFYGKRGVWPVKKQTV